MRHNTLVQYLCRQLLGFAVAFDVQGARHYKRILLGRFLKKTLVPEDTRTVLRKGLKTCEVWLC